MGPTLVVVASVEDELHQVGGKMVADVFEMHGWDSFYLGSNTPISEMVRFAKERCPDAVGLSLTQLPQLGGLSY